MTKLHVKSGHFYWGWSPNSTINCCQFWFPQTTDVFKFVRIWTIIARFTSKHIQIKWVWGDFHVRRQRGCRRDSNVRWLPSKRLMFLFFFFFFEIPSFDSVAVARQETRWESELTCSTVATSQILNPGSFGEDPAFVHEAHTLYQLSY